jgi:hypothetical protein
VNTGSGWSATTGSPIPQQRRPEMTTFSVVLVRYRKEAIRLRDKAEVTQDPTIKAELLAMARQYEELAESMNHTDHTISGT